MRSSAKTGGRNHAALAVLCGLALLGFALAGCSPLIGRDQVAHLEGYPLATDGSLGQTFVARYDGLQAIFLHLEPLTPGDGQLQLTLSSPQGQILRWASLPVASVQSPNYYGFTFEPLPGSRGQDYQLQVQLEGLGAVQAGAAPAGAYLDGALLQDGVPQEAQLAFSLGYDRLLGLAGLAQETAFWSALLLAAGCLFILPGWGLLAWIWPSWKELHWAEKLGLSAGFNLALYPILMLWSHLVHIQAGAWYAWLPPLAGALLLLWKSRSSWSSAGAFVRTPGRWGQALRSKFSWQAVALLAVIGLLFASRLWAVRGLDAPMWGDSYQHTLIAQLIVDHNGLFTSWQPYADLETFSYHFGFHSLVAVFHWVTGLPLHETVLWLGQILNCLAVLALYPLAMRLHRSPWSGVLALLLAGLLLQMPMFYTNWGRYTQLAGQILLPAAVWFTWESLEAGSRRWNRPLVAAFVLGGLILTHYRIAVFALIFIASYLILNLQGREKGGGVSGGITRGALLWKSAALVGAGLLAAAPWLLNLGSGSLLEITTRLLTTLPGQGSPFSKEYNAFSNPLNFLPAWAWFGMLLSAGWGLWQRLRSVALLALWWFLVFVATNPQMLALPGAGMITNFTLLAAAYIPASLLIGAAGAGLVEKARLPMQAQNRLPLALALFIALAALFGARQRLDDIQPFQHALLTHPDLRASAWIASNLPSNAHVLVNAFTAFGGSNVVGSDGGWWLPLFSRRQTMLPPLNYGSEKGSRPDYQAWANALVTEIQSKGIDHPDVVNLLEQRGIDYLYIGQRHGVVNSPGPLLPLEQILNSPNFKPIYHQDRVWIFERLPNPSP